MTLDMRAARGLQIGNLESLELPISISERPSNKPKIKLRARFNLFSFGFEFVYIPIRP